MRGWMHSWTPSQVTRKWVSSTWMVTDLAGVGASDPQALAGHHDDAVSGHLALYAHRAGRLGRVLAGGDPGAADLRVLIGRHRRGQRLGEHVVVDDVHEVSVEAQRHFCVGPVRHRSSGDA